VTSHRYRLPVPYEELDHTADAGVVVCAETAEAALARLILALGATLSGGAPVTSAREAVVTVGPGDHVAMAVDILRELLYRFDCERVIPAECEIRRFDPATGAEVSVGLGLYDAVLHAEGTVLKAVTWHDARFEACDGQWSAQVVFDV
jgi:SHS2 domain-containing protein